MERLLEQIRVYELMNNLIPGAVLYTLLCWHPGCHLIDDVFKEVIVCYSVGLVAGRFGSLVIEPLFKNTNDSDMKRYSAFIAASKKDPKIETLSSVCNMYRSFVAVFVLYGIWLVAEQLTRGCPALDFWLPIIGLVLLILLFVLSYRKQMQYVYGRIEAQSGNVNREEDDKHEI